jgi:hypothetical protein
MDGMILALHYVLQNQQTHDYMDCSYHLNYFLLFRLMIALIPESFPDLKASYS